MGAFSAAVPEVQAGAAGRAEPEALARRGARNRRRGSLLRSSLL